MSSADQDGPGSDGTRVVELTVDATKERVPLVRNLVEAVLFADDYALDTVADVKLGIDEACLQLVAVAPPRARLRLVVATGPAYARIEICCDVVDDAHVDESSFGWFVIGSVTDQAEVAYADGRHGREARVALTALRD
ncbi:ATP-binding protein [Gordonia araii]|nr:ATP-binding protein [Gordonia araii]NNG98494.1 ATP-binding protein [Gordonia araii NBRC 100433]